MAGICGFIRIFCGNNRGFIKGWNKKRKFKLGNGNKNGNRIYFFVDYGFCCRRAKRSIHNGH